MTSSRDKESSKPTVSVHRWRSLKATTATSAAKAIITVKMRRGRSRHIARARRRGKDARIVPCYLPDHHNRQAAIVQKAQSRLTVWARPRPSPPCSGAHSAPEDMLGFSRFISARA